MHLRPAAVVLAVAALLGAGCARKRESLPPPPPPAEAPVAPGAGAPVPPVATTAIPGSRADFLARAGSDTVYFALDSYALDERARATLDAQARWLLDHAAVRVTIEGHCDERGTREYNLALGERRANAVKNYLAARGVDAARITTISYGKERPAVEGQDEEAWAQNRRSVTVLVSGMAG
ncbi:peptidoglycan-associated lipoprotein Pal [Thermaurantiacus sp.]